MTDPLLNPQQLKAAKARTVREWMEIYIEILIERLKQIEATRPDLHPMAMSTFRTEARPAMRRIASAFEGAGLELTEEMEFEGAHPHPDERIGWNDPTWVSVPEKATYFWPDGSSLSFTGADARHSLGFFLFWQNYQMPVIGMPQGGEKRILTGGVDYDRYFAAKKADQQQGLEPDDRT